MFQGGITKKGFAGSAPHAEASNKKKRRRPEYKHRRGKGKGKTLGQTPAGTSYGLSVLSANVPKSTFGW